MDLLMLCPFIPTCFERLFFSEFAVTLGVNGKGLVAEVLRSGF